MNGKQTMEQIVTSFEQADFDQLLLLKYQGACALKIPQDKVTTKRQSKKFFYISDTEVLKIFYLRLKAMGLHLTNPRIERNDKNESYSFVRVSDDIEKITAEMYPFNANLIFRGKKTKNDDILCNLIAKNMTNKFGEGYKRAYLKHWISYCRTSILQGDSIMGNCDILQKRLCDIEKSSQDCHLLLFNTKYGYDDLENI